MRYSAIIPCLVLVKQQEAIAVLLAACPHPALSSLFPWPGGCTGLAPSSVPALSACSLGTEQQEKLGLLSIHPAGLIPSAVTKWTLSSLENLGVYHPWEQEEL